ncbi:hypothetical protein LTR53_015879 [Teratosphaeriaceae sp. CCFEE 6253]|nr:hypothetical protein LTR53_015879 [Teratosphaeriaceae sp. CCFEE 6253]
MRSSCLAPRVHHFAQLGSSRYLPSRMAGYTFALYGERHALSYSWGTSPATWRTLTTNIAPRSTGFSFNELPATLRDAIDITEKLGVRYIWIDSCCIVQDDEADWLRESVTMGEVYSQALFCISASSSTSSHDGCHNLTSASTLDDGSEVASITSTLSNGERSTLHIPYHRAQSQYHKQVTNGPLSSRAWTYREKVMSQRVLHFTSKQLFWQCRHGILSEDNADAGTADLGSDATMSQWREVVWQNGDQALDTLSVFQDERLGAGETTVCKLERLWYNDVVGEQYSRRELSHRKDKLVALAGLAKAVQRRTGSRYVAGLWEPSFLNGLAWTSHQQGHKPTQYEAPSWSWASQDSKIYYTNFGGATVPLCKVKGVYVRTDNDGDFGRVRDGWVDLEGHVFDVRITEDTKSAGRQSGPSAHFPHGERCAATMDNEAFCADSATALPLLHDEYQVNFLLLRATDSEVAYKRVGTGMAWRLEGTAWEHVEFLTSSPRSAIRVI